MATSGTTSFQMEVDEIVRDAFAQIGAQPIGAADAQQARRFLNLMFIDLMNKGVPLSKVELKTRTLTSGVAVVTLDSEDMDVADIVIARSSTEYPLTRYSQSEYLRIPNKYTTARPTIYTVIRERDQSLVKLWPIPDNSTDTLNYYVTTKIEDVNKATETVDLPTRYLPFVVYRLAFLLSGIRTDVPPERRAELKALSEEFLTNAREEDSERSANQIIPFPYISHI